MYYKNYIINYGKELEVIVIAETYEDIPKDASGEWILSHTKKLFDVPTYELEHCREYLANNGLYLSIFPPEFIEQGIKEYNEFQNRVEKERLKKFEYFYFNKLADSDFNKLKNDRMTFVEILDFLSFINEIRVSKYNLKAIDIKEYKLYLEKYWSDEIV